MESSIKVLNHLPPFGDVLAHHTMGGEQLVRMNAALAFWQGLKAAKTVTMSEHTADAYITINCSDN